MMEQLTRYARLAEAELEIILPPVEGPQARLHEAMRYAVMGGGKRLRPALVLASAEVFGGVTEQALPAASAVELVHCFSLVHDDLPALDDDELRRGRPTCHKAFSEATAILAGDALLALGFEVLALYQPQRGLSAETTVETLRILGHAIGSLGVAGGEFVDLEMEGQDVTAAQLEFIHLNKTAALIEACLLLGATVAGARTSLREAAGEYGRNLGLLFQLVDDLLGEVGDESKTGKPVGRDRELGKATYVRLYGLEGARAEAERLAGKARALAARFEPEEGFFHQLVDYVAGREA